MTDSLRRVLLLLLAALVLYGCGTSRDTVTVVDRPEAPTEEATTGDTAVAPPAAISIPAGYDTVTARRFDRGKMWTFETPPADYFEDAHDFSPDSSWFGKAQQAALRFGDGCSASFVSGSGLVMTNHHCAREYITKVSRSGENLLESGFYAASQTTERQAPDLHVDQLINIQDVTQRVYDDDGPEGTASSRQQRVESIEETMTANAKKKNESLRVDIMPLYRGARYSAYTYRRYEDVRLVMAPELALGYFGGSADNFTYPRFALDVAFFRVYTEDGEPLQPSHHFAWDAEGAQVGESVFAVGNPGSTSRLEMVSQMEFQRAYDLPNRLEVLQARSSLLKNYIDAHPAEADTFDLRNTYFSVENTIKSLKGQLRGLRDPYLLARRGKAVRALQDSIARVDSLEDYGRIIQEIERLQQSKRILAAKDKAFTAFASQNLGSRILARALYGYYYNFLQTRGAPPDRVEEIRAEAVQFTNWPAALEEKVMEAQLTRLRSAYGPQHPSIQRIMKSRSPSELAAMLVENSALTDSTAFVGLLEEGYLESDDPSVPVIEALAPLFLNTNRQLADIQSSEQDLNARLSRARFAVYGATIPPDASFTLRISDGVVKGYPYNGTSAPAHTNFYGLYDRHHAHEEEGWDLPAQWLPPPAELDLGTPLNLVSTNDISGGNSGSPLLNEDLEIVGVVFDSNIEALPNEYLYRTKAARAVSVDARGIIEVLRAVYDADRLVNELLATPSEAGGGANEAAAPGPESRSPSEAR
jgi:hypothetical protein